MGRRKARKKPYQNKKVLQALPKEFDCPFCNHVKTCAVEMDRDGGSAHVFCEDCSESFSTSINNLSQPIDVYNEWIDACESVNQSPRR